MQWKIKWRMLDIIHTRQTLLLVKMIHREFFRVQEEGCPGGVSEYVKRADGGSEGYFFNLKLKFLFIAV